MNFNRGRPLTRLVEWAPGKAAYARVDETSETIHIRHAGADQPATVSRVVIVCAAE